MGNVHMEATQINYRGGSKKMSVEEAIKAAGTEITPEEKTWIDSIPALTSSNAGKTDQDVIAPEFDSEAGVYAVGNKVMYDGKLYEFTTAHETPGDWDSSEVSETTVADELNSLESGLTNVENNIASFPDNLKRFNILYANTTSSAANKVFDLSGRGCGLIFINRNGIGGTILSIATDVNGDVSTAKLSGSDITIDATTSSQTIIALPTWSSVIIMTNNSNWSEVTT